MTRPPPHRFVTFGRRLVGTRVASTGHAERILNIKMFNYSDSENNAEYCIPRLNRDVINGVATSMATTIK